MKLRLGTRGSPLALKQTQEIVTLLEGIHPEIEVQIQKIRTSGDRVSEWNQPPREIPIGAFVRELEEALLAGEIDAAVHSLKDLPTALPEALELVAIPPRRNPADALLTRGRIPLSALPEGARIGTGSLRRKVQILRLRPDLKVLPIRGNLDTRVKKCKSGEVEGIVVAAAGMERLGIEAEITEVLGPDRFLPAVGQGAIGIEIHRDRGRIREILSPLDHPQSRAAVTAERGFLHRLGVGCRAPAAAFAWVADSGKLVLTGMVSDPEGRNFTPGEGSGPTSQAEEIGKALADRLLSGTRVPGFGL